MRRWRPARSSRMVPGRHATPHGWGRGPRRAVASPPSRARRPNFTCTSAPAPPPPKRLLPVALPRRLAQPGWVGWVGWVVMVASKPLCLAIDDPEYVAVKWGLVGGGEKACPCEHLFVASRGTYSPSCLWPRFRGSCHHAFLLSFCSSRDTPRVRHPHRYSLYPFRIRVPFGHTSTGNQLTAVGGGLVGGSGALVALSGGAVHRRPPQPRGQVAMVSTGSGPCFLVSLAPWDQAGRTMGSSGLGPGYLAG